MQCKKSSTDHSPSINSKHNTFSSSQFGGTPRKPPKARVYGEDEINSEAFKSMAIATFSEVNESLLKSLGNGFLFQKMKIALFSTDLTQTVFLHPRYVK